MTLEELNVLLKATGYPVAYSHFNESPDNPPPKPPFITYMVSGSGNFFGDDVVYKKINNVQVELYTNIKDLAAEKKIEDLLDAREIAYESDETWIQAERIFQKIYEFGVI